MCCKWLNPLFNDTLKVYLLSIRSKELAIHTSKITPNYLPPFGITKNDSWAWSPFLYILPILWLYFTTISIHHSSTINHINIVNTIVCECVCLLLFHPETGQRIWMKFNVPRINTQATFYSLKSKKYSFRKAGELRGAASIFPNPIYHHFLPSFRDS